MEQLEETFIMSLHIENADPGVRISHQPSTVIISDNDGLYTYKFMSLATTFLCLSPICSCHGNHFRVCLHSR